jgi:nitrate/nitrite transporter NarK
MKKGLKVVAFLAVVFAAEVVFGAGDTSGIKSKFTDMADMVFDVARYIGIYGGLGGAIISLLFRFINKDQNIWADALKILGAGAALAAFSSILKIIAGWI